MDLVSTNVWQYGSASPTAVGVIRSIAPIEDATALLAAAPGYDPITTADDGEGVWLATYTESSGIAYDDIAWSNPFGGTCTSAEFFAYSGQSKIVYDADMRGASSYDTVAYVTSRNDADDCDGVAKLEYSATGSPHWTAVDHSGCTDLAVNEIRGAAVSRDSRWLMIYGGPAGGVCAIDLTSTSDPGTQVVTASGLDIQIKAVMPHPHIDDTFYIGGFTDSGADTGGVLMLERRWAPGASTWLWNARLLGLAEFEHRSVVDIEWGGSIGDTDHMHDVYAATAGGGTWDLHLTRN